MRTIKYLILAFALDFFLIYTLFTERIFSEMVTVILVTVIIIIELIISIHFYNIYQQFNGLNKTIEEILNGNLDARVISNHYVHNRELNANINRLAKRLEKMAFKKEEDEHTIHILTNNINSPIIYIDRDGKIHYVNNQFLSHFQSTLEINDIYEKLRIRKLYNFIDDAFTFENRQVSTLQIGERYYSANAIPINNHYNNIKNFIGILFIFYDITEIKRYEKLQREFLADASHELKTPISAIKGASEILLNGDNHSKETVNEFLTIINKENERMERIVSDILLISRLENETIHIRIERINLSLLIIDCIDSIRFKLENKNQTLKTKLIDHLYIEGSYEKLKGAFLNLFTNAINYTNENKSLYVTMSQTDENIIVSIKDEGIGMSETDLPHIFDRFYRIDKARSRETGGTGLGLAIVKSTMDIHKAKIEVKSKPNEGTEFIIYFKKGKTTKN